MSAEGAMDKGSFLKEVEYRIGVEFPSLAEDCTRSVLKVLRRRIGTDQDQHIAAHLPKELKEEWEKMPDTFQRMDKHEFLEAVKKEAEFRNTDEAFQATSAVFGALKVIIPEKDVADTADTLPEDLRDIWLLAA